MSLPQYSSLSEVYPPTHLDEAKKRYQALYSAFEKQHGGEPSSYVRSPGRVNLIGEHVDYSGYSVFPMALVQDVAMAVRTQKSRSGKYELHIGNVNSEKFDSKSFEFELNDEEGPIIEIDPEAHHWTNYVLCGFKGVIEDRKLTGPVSVQVCVDGRVPTAAGLSSSSALVVTSVLCALVAHGCQDSMSKSDIASLATRVERFVGTESGGMDQAISVLGEGGYAQHIEFNPLRNTRVKLPNGATWIVAHTLVEAEKQRTAAELYNKRVVECRLAARLIGKKLELETSRIKTFRDLEVESNLSLMELQKKIPELLHEKPYTTKELESLFGVKIATLVEDLQQARKVFHGNANADPFLLYQRSMHTYTEVQRVQDFQAVCESKQPDTDKISALGKILDAGQRSCAELYHCSCPELDELCSKAKHAGAVGARLTGAGWGGCAVILVKDGHVDEFMARLEKSYYKDNTSSLKATIESYLFATKPASGSAVIQLRTVEAASQPNTKKPKHS